MPLTKSGSRRIEVIAYLLGGALVLGAFLFLGFSGTRSLAIVVALVAVVIARYLYVSLPERLDRTDNPQDGTGIDPLPEASQEED